MTGSSGGAAAATRAEAPLVSVVLETYNASAEDTASLDEVLDQLRVQTHPADRLEVVITVDEEDMALARAIAERHPWTRIVPLRGANYYAMKRRGMEAARGDVVVLTDADCKLPVDFVERIVRDIEGGADVVVGKVRFTPGRRFARTFDVFAFGHIKAGPDGRAAAFSVNNVAFRRAIVDRYGFDPRVQRSGGAYLLVRQLLAAGHRLVYDPEIVVVHDFHDVRFQVLMRARTGYEMVNLTRIDDEGVVPETRFKALGLLAPPVSAARRFAIDCMSFLRERDHLGIRVWEVPYFVLVSLLVRSLEAGVGVATVIRPDYFARRMGW